MRRKNERRSAERPKDQDVPTCAIDLLTVAASRPALSPGLMTMIAVGLGSVRSRGLFQSMNSG